MKKILVLLTLFAFIGCASTNNKDLMGQYYMAEKKIVYANVTPPYGKYRYPVRLGERVLRIWVAPKVVNDYIMVEGHYIYVTVSKSRWYVEPVKPLYK